MRHYTLLLFALFGSLMATAQPAFKAPVTILDPAQFPSSRNLLKEALYQNHYILSSTFEAIPDRNTRKKMRELGIELLNWQGGKKYRMAFPETLTADQLTSLGVRNLSTIPTTKKLSAALLQEDYPAWAFSGSGQIRVAIHFHQLNREEPGEQKERLSDFLQAHGADLEETYMKGGQIVLARIPVGRQYDLAAAPQVAFVDLMAKPESPLNQETRNLLKANVLHRLPESLGLKGKGVVVGVGDGGSLGNHIDFAGRVIDKANGTFSSFGAHGDITSGIIGGGGNLNARHAGMAPECTLIIEKVSGIVFNAEKYFDENRMVLTNNSYGSVVYCQTEEVYNYTSVDLDWRANIFEKQLHIFAAGNGGTHPCPDYPTGFFTILPYAQSAKNVISVGMVDENRVVAAGSSRGPTFDGRIKPEVVGIGANAVSTGRDFNYHTGGGTSASAPSVTGALALLYQQYRARNNDEDPDGGLVKAIACNTADDLGHPGPDFTYGFGLVNLRRAYTVIDQQQYIIEALGHDETRQHQIEVPEGLSQLKVVLYWTDREAEGGARKALVNDLDLAIRAPDGTNWQPWVLNPDPSAVDALATRGRDTLNNIEQITIDDPGAGLYDISVNGRLVPDSTQKYFVVYEFVHPEVVLTFPFGGEQMEGGTQEYLQWDVEPTNTSPFKLEYSTDNGVNWQLIADEVPADRRNWLWTVPDIRSSKAFVRISKTADGSFDINPAFAILPLPEMAEVSPLCEGYAQLNWHPVDDAGQYTVLSLDKTNMKEIGERTDSFMIVDNPINPGERYWYSVRAKLLDGVLTERSLSIPYISASTDICPWPDDLKSVALTSNRTLGRANTSLSLNSEQLMIKVKNVGNNVPEGFSAQMRVNGEAMTAENITASIAPGDSLDYVFTNALDLSAAGTYTIDAWISTSADSRHKNDSLLQTLKIIQLENDPVSLPYLEDFSTMEEFPCDARNTGLKGIPKWDFISNSGGCLVDGWLSAGMSIPSGPEADFEQEDELILTLNLEELELANGLMLSLSQYSYADSGQVRLWTRGEDTKEWLEVAALPRTNGWEWDTLQPIDLGLVLIAGGHTLSSSFQIRFTRKGSEEYYLNHIFLEQPFSVPVEWSTFTAIKVGEDVQLDWATLSERNNDFFEVQLAYNSKEKQAGRFATIGAVEGSGTSGEFRQYQFIDDEPWKFGARYYRLKQQDYDGSFSYSPVVAVDFPEPQNKISVFPNPFSETLQIDIISEGGDIIQINLFDRLGRMVADTRATVQTGYNRIDTETWTRQLPAGVYFLSLEQGGQIFYHKLIKY